MDIFYPYKKNNKYEKYPLSRLKKTKKYNINCDPIEHLHSTMNNEIYNNLNAVIPPLPDSPKLQIKKMFFKPIKRISKISSIIRKLRFNRKVHTINTSSKQ